MSTDPRRESHYLPWIYAGGAWLLALAGAFGLAWMLRLGWNDTLILVGAVAVVAFFGSFLPVLRLVRTRGKERR